MGIPDEEVLEQLARKIPDEWKSLGRRLKLDEAEITALNKEHDEYSEKAYQMLLKWKKANGKEATFNVLYEALLNSLVDRKDLAETFCCASHE